MKKKEEESYRCNVCTCANSVQLYNLGFLFPIVSFAVSVVYAA